MRIRGGGGRKSLTPSADLINLGSECVAKLIAGTPASRTDKPGRDRRRPRGCRWKRKGPERKRAQRRACPGEARLEGGKRSVAAVPAAQAQARADTDWVDVRVRRSRVKNPGTGPERSGMAASPEAQANGPPKALCPDSLCRPARPSEDGRGIRFSSPLAVTHPSPRGSAVCVSRPGNARRAPVAACHPAG
jgi:hypothetical protein